VTAEKELVKVLIVDDDEGTRKMLTRFITREGFNVVQAEDAAIAIQKINTEKPDILLTDLKMPHGNGLDIIRYIKKEILYSQAILMTAFAEADTVIMALREGVIDYLRKPMDLEAVALALGRAQEKIVEYKQATPISTILVVEDDQSTRSILASILHKKGWAVLEAENAAKALEIFKDKKIDIALLDINMPGMDGLAALREMRQIKTDFEAIMVTGYSDEQKVIKALEYGAINFVKKPVDLDQLVVFIKEALETLDAKRILKFRSRELELSKNVVARLAIKKGMMIVDFPASGTQISSEMAMTVLDLLPMGLVLVNEKKKVLYANAPVQRAQEGQKPVWDEKFLKCLNKMGARGISFGQVDAMIEKMLTLKVGAVETIKVGEWGYISLVRLMLILNDNRESVVLMIIRGERF